MMEKSDPGKKGETHLSRINHVNDIGHVRPCSSDTRWYSLPRSSIMVTGLTAGEEAFVSGCVSA